MKRSDNSRYLDYSSLIDDEENAVSLSGGNAEALVKKLESVKERRAVLFQEKEDKEYYLSQNISRRKALEKGGLDSDQERVEDSKAAPYWMQRKSPAVLSDRAHTRFLKASSFNSL